MQKLIAILTVAILLSSSLFINPDYIWAEEKLQKQEAIPEDWDMAANSLAKMQALMLILHYQLQQLSPEDRKKFEEWVQEKEQQRQNPGMP